MKNKKSGIKLHDNFITRWYLDRYLLKNGINKKFVPQIRKQLIRDWNISDNSVSDKIWALRSGFLPSRINLYNLTKENAHTFLSDFDIERIYRANNHFEFWINDKITLKYILRGDLALDNIGKEMLNYMPEYYLYVENDGRYSYLMDVPHTITRDSDFLLNLLKYKGELALKPSNGSGGRGFMHLTYVDGVIYSNSKEMPLSEFEEMKHQINGYIITEYVHQHHELQNVWNESECTLRIIVAKTWPDVYSGGKLNVVASYARFGTRMSEGACNMNTGGVAVSFDFNSGNYGKHFFRYPGFDKDGICLYDSHPDTGVVLDGKKLPNCELVKKATYCLCNYLSSLEFFGLDFVITEDSVKLLEVNSLPPLFTPQSLDGAILVNNPEAREFFKKKLEAKRKK